MIEHEDQTDLTSGSGPPQRSHQVGAWRRQEPQCYGWGRSPRVRSQVLGQSRATQGAEVETAMLPCPGPQSCWPCLP